MHERIISLNMIAPLKVESQEQYDEFCRALGRTMLYNIQEEGEDVVSVLVNRDADEILATYSRSAKEEVGERGRGKSPVWEMSAQVQNTVGKVGSLITIGAIRSSVDGKYGFHS